MVDHMTAFTLIADIVGNHTLMCVHTDGNHADTATFPTKQKHTHTHTQIWKMLLKKKRIICPKSRSLSYAPIKWQLHHSVHHAPSRESGRIQINNLLRIFHFFFFWMVSFCLWNCVLKNHVVFLPPRCCFWCNLATSYFYGTYDSDH